MRSERFNLLIFGANIIFLIFALSVLLYLKNRFEGEVGETIQNSMQLFTRDVLGGPDNLHVHFSDWEPLAKNIVSMSLVQRLIVTKIVSENGRPKELVVVPFDYLAKNEIGPDLDPTLEKRKLFDEEGQFGALYFELDLSTLKSVQVAIWALAVMLALALVVLTTRLWTQERQLTQTTVELEEKGNQLIRLERLALAGQLTVNIFHDIKKPVLNIRHELEDLGESLGNFAGASKGLRHIRDQVDLFFAMLRDLNLERFVRSEDAEEEYVELPKIVEQSCRLVQYERGAVNLQIQAAPGLPLALAQPYRLIQVFSNLTLNAYEAMDGHGELRIDIQRDGDLLEVRLTDSGPGIALEHLPHIFTPFYSTKIQGGGAGLGLYISRQIIEELNGEINVESKDAVGATFIVTLPAAAPGK